MRYTKKARRNKRGHTTRVDIIDNTTGQVVASFPTTGGQSREEGVGIANRDADAELARLNAAAEEAGENYGSREEMQAAENEKERRQRLDEDVAKFEDRITEAGRLREDLAQNVSARRQGQLLSQLQRSILGTGGDAGMVEALTPQITEQSNRTLQDLITGSQAQTQRDLAQFVPREIAANYNQDALSDAMSRFLMEEETQRAQIQANLDGQPEWWETMLGQAAGEGGKGVGQAATNLLTSFISGGL
mgnify:CR=1 FL=1|jgi:ribosomal protein S18|tara:strand:+ start:1135 stop:1875 length:741 start_codon:yes stop_codon:yes gene_type:complete